MQQSKIEWTDKTWNPVTGCTKVSQGCKNCYAETLFKRFGKLWGQEFKNVQCHTDRLMQPLKWKKPAKIFVNSMSDLFHEDVSFEFINAVFSVMSDVDIHTYQILTKRPQRMLEFFQWKEQQLGFTWQPKNNVWLGISVEDQKTANERLPYLNSINAEVKFISCEPLLDSIDLSEAMGDTFKYHGGGLKNCVNWVIAGGESGMNARPIVASWVRSIRDQCAAGNVAFFFKQWGKSQAGRLLDGQLHSEFPITNVLNKTK